MFPLLITSALIGVVCGAIVNIFYVAVRHAWPQNYYGLEGSADPLISRNLPRYLGFRFLPPFLGFLAAAVTAERLASNVWVAVTAAFLIHAYRLVIAIRWDRKNCQYVVAVGHGVILAVVLFVAIIAALLRSTLKVLVPTPADLVSSLWIGLIAAVGAVYLQRVALIKQSPEKLLLTSIEDVRSTILQHAHSQSQKLGVPAVALFALMFAENLERPAWFRWLEMKWPGNRELRTLGIMQQRHSYTDEDSVDRALTDYFVPEFGSWAPSNATELDLQTPLTNVLRRYNRSDDFSALALRFLELLDDQGSAGARKLEARLKSRA